MYVHFGRALFCPVILVGYGCHVRVSRKLMNMKFFHGRTPFYCVDSLFEHIALSSAFHHFRFASFRCVLTWICCILHNENLCHFWQTHNTTRLSFFSRSRMPCSVMSKLSFKWMCGLEFITVYSGISAP